jgi:pyruvate ferredoxin oxidoreductase alpha subunit
MVCQDGFITSHAVEGIKVFPDEQVKKFIGEYTIEHSLIDVDHPVTYGPLDLQDYYFEHKRQQAEAMKNALKVIPQVLKEFNKEFGTNHDLVEEYKLRDADVAIICLSSTAGTAKVVVDALREKGLKVGLLKPRFFRPFPKDRIEKAISHLKAIAVLDRSESFSDGGGPIYNEIRSALYDSGKNPLLINRVFGLGGRDIFESDIEKVYNDLLDIAKKGKIKGNQIDYIGVR